MLDSLFNILNSNLLIGFLLLVVVIPMYVRLGIFGKLMGKNGNGKKNEIAELKEQLVTLQENHITHLDKKLEEFIKEMVVHNTREIILLENILKKLDE